MKTIVAIGLLLALTSNAFAIERTCATGQTWDANLGKCVAQPQRNCQRGYTWNPSKGACVKKKEARKASPEELFYAAIDQLEGKAKGSSAAKGAALLDQACSQKLAAACTVLGFVYLNGRGVPADPKRSLDAYKQGCELGDDDGCIGAADVHSRGLLGQVDHASAIPYLDKACTHGSGRACVLLAEKYEGALGTSKNDDKAARLYEQAYDALQSQCPGDSTACFQLGNLYTNGKGTRVDEKKAFDAYSSGCDGGSGDACYELARAYFNGNGVAQDQPQAIAVLGRACKQYDNALACHDAVVTAEDMKDVMTPDDMFALATRACELDARQCEVLGHLYGTGTAVKEDQDTAAHWYLTSCNAGSALSCNAMGYRTANGSGTVKDGATAVQFWDRACQGDHADGCVQAGKSYDAGEIVPADHSRAFEYFRLGCVRGGGEACAWAGDLLAAGTDGTGHKKPDQALGYYDESCKDGWVTACSVAGDYYRDGAGTHVDPRKAIERYTRGCEGVEGDLAPSACESLGRLKYLGQGTPKDVGDALVAFARACRYGRGSTCYYLDGLAKEGQYGDDAKQLVTSTLEDACSAQEPVEDACVALSGILENGYSIAKNVRRSFQLIDDSCKRGAEAACLAVASAYARGAGVVTNSAKAKDMYSALCDKGVSSACVQLGSILGDEGKNEQAVTLYQRACDDGDAQGCNAVGFAHYTAQGARWDVVAAAKGYQKACDLGEAVGCSNVGELYEYGIAYAKDPKKAYEYYGKGCTPSEDVGCGRLARFYASGTGGAQKDVDRAIKEYRRACDASYSSPDACRELADLLQSTGKGATSEIAALNQKAFARAKELSAKNPFYQYVLGTYYRDGVATVRDPKKATELFVSACEGYDPLGCLAAGHLLMEQGDREKAVVELDRACAAQVKEACDVATTARGGKGGVPMSGGKGGGCGCQSDAPSPAGAALFMSALLLAVRRRRR
ncbi:MAG TPA: tetratricopeptide repeat protein [Kofleriaceae bacterium]|nr:tetratricopeptide repeat protein [Kofleriaceae bacterium]